MSTGSTASRERKWVDGTAAARILDVAGPSNVKKLADEGLILTRDLPGTRERYLKEDVLKLARIVRPAEGETAS